MWQRGCLGEKNEQKHLQNTSRLGEVFPFPTTGWAQRGSAVGKEKSLVPWGGGFWDLQGKRGVDMRRARTHKWAVVAWLPLNFILHLPFCSKMLPKETFLVVVPHTPRQGLPWSLQPAPAKGGWHGSCIFYVFNSRWTEWSQEVSGQAPAGLVWYSL